MAKLQFLRKGHIIRTLHANGQHEDKHYMMKSNGNIPSISAAKRASRALQEENGGAGRGSLKVVTDFSQHSDAAE